MPQKKKSKNAKKKPGKKPQNKKKPNNKQKTKSKTNNNENNGKIKDSNNEIKNNNETTKLNENNNNNDNNNNNNNNGTNNNGTNDVETNGNNSDKRLINGSPKKNDDNNDEKQDDTKKDDKTILAEQLGIKRKPRRWKVDPDAAHKFWDNQPVPHMKQKIKQVNEPMELKTLDDVRKEPLALPAAFKWSKLDLNDDKQLEELYKLLANHYVEDDDNMFRFNYSKEFLKWALLVPGYKQEWHLGVRVSKSNALCGCITAIPANVSVYDKAVDMVEINFLCVHKNLRSKRLAPVLIKEITRRVNVTDRWQAVYTAGVVIPKPIATNRYWHRSLNPKKLIDVGFSCLRKRATLPRLKKLYKLDKKTKTDGLRPMKETDCIVCLKMLNEYLSKFKLHCNFNLEEFKHIFLPRNNVIYSYVVQNKDTNKITDFISFYELPSSILSNENYNEMKAAYSFYNVSTNTSWEQLIGDALIIAKNNNFDVFNALDVMENSKFLKNLKFGIGDGHLQYYLFNWKCPDMKPQEIGVVLL